jgi:ABC-type protease/lipase transport system fused ATPase/permease subunit
MQSYANAIVSSFEDPEKILEQAVLEMNDDLTKMRQATAQVSYFLFFGFFWTLLFVFIIHSYHCYILV